MGIRKPKSLFNRLPTDLQTKIFRGLSVRDQSKAMCVSHSWRNRILTTTLPKEYPLQPLVVAVPFPDPFTNLERLFNWCSLVMCCSVGPQNIIDSCNGLLLFCHKDGQARNIVCGVYHYYVLNPITKQCVAILKPSGQLSEGYSYAALAYDPSESWFFNIIHFQGHHRINIFSSMTGLWTTLTICFPQYINESYWVRKSVYLKRSIYRLSCLGYLLKIKVDPQENVLNQAEVIALHPDCLFDNCQREISVKDGKIILVSSRGVNFVCYELVECVTMGVSSYTWHIIHNTENMNLLMFNTNGKLLSFDPYRRVAFFTLENVLYHYFYDFNGSNITKFGIIGYDPSVYDYIRNDGHLLLKCFAPFACCLDKEVISCINFHKKIFPVEPNPLFFY